MTEQGEDDIQTDAAIDLRETALASQSQAISNAMPAQQPPVVPPGTFHQQLNSSHGNQFPSNVHGQVYVPTNQNQTSQPLPLQHLHGNQVPPGAFGQQHQPAAQQWYHPPGQAPAGYYPMYSGPQQGYPGYQCAMNQQPNAPSQYHPTSGQVPYSQHSQQDGFVPQNQHPMGHQYQYPQVQPLVTVPLYQREGPARPPRFTAVPPTTEHYDAALVFAKKDQALADEIVEMMNNLELKDGYKPKVCCSDRDDFGANVAVKAKPMLKVCTLIFVVLTQNLKEDEAAAVVREEAIGMTRLAPKEDCDEGRRYCVRPLHTLSPEERRGVYSVPCGLTSIDPIDWYKFGNKSFNRRLKQTFEYFLHYRLKREREETPSSRSTLHDIISSPNVNLNYQRMLYSNAQPQFQQGQQGYANMSSSQQYADGSINVHPSIPTFSANPSNNTSVSPSPSNPPTGSVELACTRSTGPSGQTAESIGSGEVQGPSHDDSSGSQVSRNIVTGGNVASDLTHQSNVAHHSGSNSRVRPEDNERSQNSTMVRSTRLPQDSHTSSRSNQEPCPAAGTSEAAVGRSVVSEQTLGKKASSQSAAAQSGDSVENVPVSTLHARVGGDSEASHGATSVQNPNSSQQVNPESRINTEQTTPITSSLPTEVDKDSGAESLPMANTGIGDSETESELHDDSARPQSDKFTGLKSRSALAARSPQASSDPEAMPRSQKARTPGDGQERENQPVYRPTQIMETKVKPVQKLETYSKEHDEGVLKVKSSGPAYTSAKCAGANDGHLEITGVSREASAAAAQVVHHYHHFSGANSSTGPTDSGQITDPNLVLPDQLRQGISQAVHQDRVPPRRTEAARDRMGESYVHLNTTTPINIVNCNNVQIGRNRINIRSAQPETQDRTNSGTSDGADDDVDDDDDDENNISSASVDCPSSAPPPYSQHDPRGGPSRAPARFQTELKQRDTGFSPGIEASRLVGSTQTEVKQINTSSDPRTEGSGLAGSSQTEVKRRLPEPMSPSNTSEGSSNSETAVKRRFTVPEVLEGSATANKPAGNSSPLDHIGMIPDGGYPSHETSVGVSVNLQNRGQLVGGQQGNLGQGQLCPTNDLLSQRQNPAVSLREDDTDRLGTGAPQVERGELTVEDLPSGQGDSSSSYFLDSLPDDGQFLVEAANKLRVHDAESKGDNSMQQSHHSRSMHSTSSTNEEKSVGRMRSPNKRRQDVFLAAGKHCIKNQTQKQSELHSHHDELD